MRGVKHDYGQYTARNLFLRKRGYASYEDYLQSEVWKSIKAAVLDRTPKCEVCTGDASIIHHAKYSASTLFDSDDPALVSMCNGCHQLIEFANDGKKLDWSEVNDKLLRLLTRRECFDRAKALARAIGRKYRRDKYQ